MLAAGDVVEAENAFDSGYDDVSNTPTRPHNLRLVQFKLT